MEKLSREQQKLRKAMEKAFDAAFKAVAKRRKWGYRTPTAFLMLGDWFVSISPIIWTDARRSRLWVTVKPFALDDLVSRIMLHDGLDGAPLSLRVRGPHCLPRPMFEASIEDDMENVDAMVQAAETFAKRSLERIALLTLDDFITFARDRLLPPGQVSVEHVAALILARRNDEALQLCEAAIAAKQWGGPARTTEDGRLIGFFEFARRWISAG